jgi:hypothetical protein
MTACCVPKRVWEIGVGRGEEEKKMGEKEKNLVHTLCLFKRVNLFFHIKNLVR